MHIRYIRLITCERFIRCASNSFGVTSVSNVCRHLDSVCPQVLWKSRLKKKTGIGKEDETHLHQESNHRMVKVIESVVFVPYTPGSVLKNRLQEMGKLQS